MVFTFNIVVFLLYLLLVNVSPSQKVKYGPTEDIERLLLKGSAHEMRKLLMAELECVQDLGSYLKILNDEISKVEKLINFSEDNIKYPEKYVEKRL